MTDEELDLFLSVSPLLIQAYVGVKRLTALRSGDMLKIRLADLTADGLLVTQAKTGTRLLYEWTPELRVAIDQTMRLPRVNPRIVSILYGARSTLYGERVSQHLATCDEKGGRAWA